MLLRILRRRGRSRRERQRAVEDGLRMLAQSIAAPDHVKRAGLERLIAEFERERRREG